MTMSSPERAILELLDEVPKRETFHQADVLVEGLRNLSPRRLQTLLVACRRVKVKRLFLWFAERHEHAWLKKLDRKDIDLGHGKRMLVRGGKLDPTFNITVPESIDAGARECKHDLDVQPGTGGCLIKRPQICRASDSLGIPLGMQEGSQGQAKRSPWNARRSTLVRPGKGRKTSRDTPHLFVWRPSRMRSSFALDSRGCASLRPWLTLACLRDARSRIRDNFETASKPCP